MKIQLRMLLLLAFLVPLVGCGDSGPPTAEITGLVTFDGKPVEKGGIIFRPTDGEAAARQGDIVDGKYTLEAPIGSMKVEITGQRDTGVDDGMGGTEWKQFIPEKYNTKTTLTADVSKSGEKVFDFELKP